MEASSEFFTGGYFGHPGDGGMGGGHTPVDHVNGANNFTFDEFLDFPKEDEVMTDACFDSITGNSGESSSLTVVESCNSSVSGGGDGQFNGNLSSRSFTGVQFSGTELCVPYDDLADLEWLSNFVEESFSTDDLQTLHLTSPAQNGNAPSIAALTATTDTSSATTSTLTNAHIINPSPIFHSNVSVPGKARSRRSRAAPCDWSSRLLLLSRRSSPSDNTGNTPILVNPETKANKNGPSRKREPAENPNRRCLHCGSDKTPQWRTGPMGPKTLCNACGVRYKSGRLVPEYRPAASPTFVATKHSNSHRKVMELRRQKELHVQTHQQQPLDHASLFGISNGANDFFHHHISARQNVGANDFRLMI